MSYKVTNKSGGLIVCDLAVKDKTLRLNNKQSKTIKDNEITPHIKNMAKQGLVLVLQVPEKTKKENATKSSKEKEE